MDKNEALELYNRLRELILGSDDYKIALVSLRQVLERLYKNLCRDSQSSFSGLFARMQYIHEKLGINQDMDYQLNQARISCNKASHDDMSHGFEAAFLAGLLAISHAISFFYGLEPDQIVTDYLIRKDAQPYPKRASSPKFSFSAVLQSWSKRDNAIELTVISEEGYKASILLWDDLKCGSEARLWSRLDLILWKHCSLQLYNLSQTSKGPGYYSNNPKTMLILEPDFLLDASSVAECMQAEKSDPQYFVLNRLFAQPMTEKMLLGSMINELFDRLVFQPESDWQAIVNELIRSYSIQLTALGSSKLSRILESIQMQHLPQIKGFINSLKADKVQLEPSFICPEFGLLGRLDLLYSKGDKYSILELKSGVAPKVDTWRSQQMQVTAYNMIMRSVLSNRNREASAILYSSEPTSPVRYVENHILREQELIYCRNRIVGILHQLCHDPQPFFDWIYQDNSPQTSPIFDETHKRYQKMRTGLDELEYSWFLEQVKLITREIWAVKLGSNDPDAPSGGGFNRLWRSDRLSKLDSYQLLENLTVLHQNNNEICLKQMQPDLVSDFRQGDVVILYRQDTPIQKQQLLRASLVSIKNGLITLNMRGGVKDAGILEDGKLWSLEHDVLDSLLYAPLCSIGSFLEAEPGFRARIMGRKAPMDTHYDLEPGEDLDSILSQISGTSTYYVIQGPPGTGKTSGLLREYLMKCYHQTGKKILILSFTNRAVDEICLNLDQAGLDYIRTGNSQVIKDKLLGNLICKLNHKEINQVLRDTRLWVSTIQSANSWLKEAIAFTTFDEVIIDEASQVIEAQILGILSHASKCILIGDQNQLPPIVTQYSTPISDIAPSLKELYYSGLQRSLMERLSLCTQKKGWPAAFNILRYHYRMHDQIASLIAHYYGHKLISAGIDQSADLAQLPTGADSWLNHRLIWIDFPLSKQHRFDPLQADCIQYILQILDRYSIIDNRNEDIGIIAPYRAMIKHLYSKLEGCWDGISIDTVERYQGSQRKVIILCLPLEHRGQLRSIQSLSEDGSIDRKLNVAISRARERLIILGNAQICSHSIHYQNVIDSIRGNHLMTEYSKIMPYGDQGVIHEPS